jgi:phenylacetate-CoA ligase
MQSSQMEDYEYLRETQITLARELVNYAFRNIPYYRRLLSRVDVASHAVRDFDDFAQIPISTKAMIRSVYPSQIYARKSWFDIKTKTSGSTGEPFECIVDGSGHCWRLASRELFNSWMGIGPEESWLRLGSDPASVRLRAYFFRREFQVPMAMTARSNFRWLVREIERIKPAGMFSAPSALALLASHIRDIGVKPAHRLKAIFSNEETLLDSQKDLISAEVSPNLFNRYGLREFGGFVAQDCEDHEGLHFNPFLVHVEVVTNNGSPASEGEIGRLILTDLRNYSMPLIRYDTGDIATGSSKCQCGRGFPHLGNVVGRQGDYMVTKLGLIPSIKVTDEFGIEFLRDVQTFQFTQFKSGKVLVKIVPTRTRNPAFEAEAACFLAKYLDDVEIQIVSEIESEPSRKRMIFKAASRDSS